VSKSLKVESQKGMQVRRRKAERDAGVEQENLLAWDARERLGDGRVVREHSQHLAYKDVVFPRQNCSYNISAMTS